MKKSIFGPSISAIPLTSSDDGNRVQMAANFQRQSLVLSNPELPLLSTPYLSQITKGSSFYQTALRDSTIIYSDSEVIVYSDASGRVRISRLPNVLWESTNAESVKKDDWLVKHWAIKYGRYCYGSNLNIVFAPFKGWNYEDAIVVSETGASKLVTRHSIELEFVVHPGEVVMKHINEGTYVRKGDVLFEMIEEPRNLVNVLCAGAHKSTVYSDYDCTINRITTYFKNEEVLEKHKSSGPFLDWVKKYSIYHRMNNLRNILKTFDPQLSKVVSLYYPENYELISNPDSILVKIECLVVKQLRVGDKLGNRHGNKGVVSKIVPDELVRSEDGWVPDLILNPLGVVSRMNIGQIFEMHLGEICRNVEKRIRHSFGEGKFEDAKKILETLESQLDAKIPYIHDTNMDLQQQLESLIENGLTVELPLYTREMHRKILDLLEYYELSPLKRFEFVEGLPKDYGYGTCYFMPLVHTVESKFSARADGPYHSKTLQPIDSVSDDAGQRLGEMEIWALLAYGADHNVVEALGAKADDIGAKEQMIAHILRTGLSPTVPETFYTNHVLHLYMYSLGIPIESDIVTEEVLFKKETI